MFKLGFEGEYWTTQSRPEGALHIPMPGTFKKFIAVMHFDQDGTYLVVGNYVVYEADDLMVVVHHVQQIIDSYQGGNIHGVPNENLAIQEPGAGIAQGS